MFGSRNDDEERFWNLMVFKVYATDKEMDEMMPGMVVLLAIIAFIGLVIYLCS